MRIFLLLAFVEAVWCLDATAATHHVRNGASAVDLQAILDAMPHRDTLFVESGSYRIKSLVILKPVVMIGKGWPILDGGGSSTAVTIQADSVIFTGFVVKNSGYSSMEEAAGIKLSGCREVRIEGNEFLNNFFGVYLQHARHCVVKNNIVAGRFENKDQNGNGIHCWYSDSLQIIGNVITNHRDGIYFEFVTSSLIWRNVAKHNLRYGLHFMFSNDDAYIANVFKQNGAGVAVMFTKRVTMIANVFERNWGDASYGLLLKEISDSYLSGNQFVQNTVGVFMEGTNRIVVEANLFDGNGWGMRIQASCMENKIEDNTFRRNTFDVSTNGSLTLNEFSGNFWDRYQGYDLDKDGYGDVPHRPLSIFSMLVEQCPPAMLLYRSFVVLMMDRIERAIPTLTPDSFQDPHPKMSLALS